MTTALSPLARHDAEADLALMRMRRRHLRQYLAEPDRSAVQRAEALAQLDAVDREATMLETLLAEQPPTEWTMSRFASADDSDQERPYQEAR